MVELLHGDCLERLRELPDCSVDACVTDPPYGLRFMGKTWDYDVPQAEVWREVLRVLKPGGHLLAFAGTRTQHRMAVQIEDAGFEIRDMIAWLYGSGFPKSLDVSKAIDKAAGAKREVVGVREDFAKRMSLSERPNTANVGGYVNPQAAGQITAPATPEAQQWDGWGTALKPALEPITVARKPFKGNVAANVLEHGTGAINIDGCRVGTSKNVPASVSKKAPANCYGRYAESGETPGVGGHDPNSGRWPANLIHDGSDEVTELFPEGRSSGHISRSESKGGIRGFSSGKGYAEPGVNTYSDTGSAARFFYCAKASKADREDGNSHPTVKPTDLMRYLCRLVTPPGGIVLDPFMGSGSTGKAAVLEGFRFIGIEREAEYIEIARGRIQVPEQVQEDLF
jgi:DNA modification methylase